MRSIPFGRPILGEPEKEAVLKVMDSGILAHGPNIDAFESSFAGFTGAPAAAGVASCTAGMHLFYFALGIGVGDEVIVPSQTHTATAHCVELVGATPVFVDAEKNTGNIDIDQIENAISDRTKAIVVVHYLGMPVDMDRVTALAKKYELLVLEDCALAIGTYYNGVHAGLLGDAGCFSFYPVKHITTAEGGMVISKNTDLIKQIYTKRAFGMDKHVGIRKTAGLYDMKELGFNYRMNEIQASIGVEQIKRIPEFLKIREENNSALLSGLRGIDEVDVLETSHGKFQSSYYCQTMILKDKFAGHRYEIINALKEKGVGTSIYYPRPVPHMTFYKEKYGFKDGSFPVASWISYNSIALPVGPHVNKSDIDYIIETIKTIFQGVCK
jgi:perosamine synthetase